MGNMEQDQYEEQGVDDEYYEALDIAERRAVDAKLGRRDAALERREGRMAGALMDGLDEDEPEFALPIGRRRRHIYNTQDVTEDGSGAVSVICPLPPF